MTAVDTPVMLRGPAPERFRTSYYGARWYIDPLPADDTWPATQDKWPAVSTIKKAWTKPFRKKLPTGDTVPLDAYWAAEFTVDNLPAINALAADKAAAMALICGAGARTLNRAADRGTGVHTVLEDLAAGKEPDPIFTDAAVQPYIPACRQFINDWQPRWLAAEFVVINRTLGFGGTGDAIIAVDIPGHGTYIGLTDWKSRGGQHGCYEEEVAQIGGYSLADYIVVNGPDQQPVRTALPDLDGGFVVSINPDGYELYPVGLEEARSAFRAMHTSWREHREGQKIARKARGNPLMPAVTSPAVRVTERPTADTTTPPCVVSAERAAWLANRILNLGKDKVAPHWPAGVPTLKQGGLTDTHVDEIVKVLDRLEADHGVPFGPVDPLFAAFTTSVDPAPAVSPEETPDPKADARANTAQARTVLEQYDPAEQQAIVKLVVPEGAQTTARHVQLIEAIAGELDDPNGAVMFTYSTLGPEIVATDADDRIRRTTGTKTGALARAKRLARELGHPTPRVFNDICINPTLAALTAAGLGDAEPQPSDDERTLK